MESILDLVAAAYPALIIAVLGVTIHTVLGWLNRKDESYNPRKATASAIIAFVLGVPTVAAEISLIDLSVATEFVATIVVFGLIAQIAGIETLVKKGADVVGNRLKAKEDDE